MKEGIEIIHKSTNHFKTQVDPTKINRSNLASIIIETQKIPNQREHNQFETVVIGNSIFKSIPKNLQSNQNITSANYLRNTKYHSDMKVLNLQNINYCIPVINNGSSINLHIKPKYERAFINPKNYLNTMSFFPNFKQSLRGPINFKNLPKLISFECYSQSSSTLQNTLQQSISKPYYSDKKVVKKFYYANFSKNQYNRLPKSSSIMEFPSSQIANSSEEIIKERLQSKESMKSSSNEDIFKENHYKKYIISPNINKNLGSYHSNKIITNLKTQNSNYNYYVFDKHKDLNSRKDLMKNFSNQNLYSSKRNSDSLLEQIDKIKLSKWE